MSALGDHGGWVVHENGENGQVEAECPECQLLEVALLSHRAGDVLGCPRALSPACHNRLTSPDFL